MAPQTEEDISRQMQESVEMQVEEFKDVESPLGFKIPKMPGSTDDLSALIGLGDSGEAAGGEKIEDLPSLDELGSKPGQQQAGGAAGGAGGAPPPPPPAGGGGMFGGGLFGARRQQ
eukprot:COSAG06_NODE_2669_length_6468_cov_28.056367_6_plen_116_part_00